MSCEGWAVRQQHNMVCSCRRASRALIHSANMANCKDMLSVPTDAMPIYCSHPIETMTYLEAIDLPVVRGPWLRSINSLYLRKVITELVYHTQLLIQSINSWKIGWIKQIISCMHKIKMYILAHGRRNVNSMTMCRVFHLIFSTY